MKQPVWVNLYFLVVAVVAIGLALAALILALDDDDRVVVGLDGATLADVLVDLGEPGTETRPVVPPPPESASAIAESIRERVTETVAALTARAAFLGLVVTEDDGALTVRAVIPGGPADSAGVQAGDQIVSVDGEAAGSLGDIRAALQGRQAGDSVRIEIDRDGDQEVVEVELGGAGPGAPSAERGPGRPNLGHPNLGLRVEPSDDGLRVTSVLPGSGAESAGIQEGDLLQSLNGASLTDAAAVREVLAALEPGDTVSVGIERDGDSIEIDVTVGEGSPGRVGPGRSPGLPDAEAIPERLRRFFERFFDGFFEGGGFQVPEGGFQIHEGRFDIDVTIVHGEVTVLHDDSITIADGESITIDDQTRRVRPVAVGDTVIVVACDGVAELIAPAPDFGRQRSSPTDA